MPRKKMLVYYRAVDIPLDCIDAKKTRAYPRKLVDREGYILDWDEKPGDGVYTTLCGHPAPKSMAFCARVVRRFTDLDTR